MPGPGSAKLLVSVRSREENVQYTRMYYTSERLKYIADGGSIRNTRLCRLRAKTQPITLQSRTQRIVHRRDCFLVVYVNVLLCLMLMPRFIFFFFYIIFDYLSDIHDMNAVAQLDVVYTFKRKLIIIIINLDEQRTITRAGLRPPDWCAGALPTEPSSPTLAVSLFCQAKLLTGAPNKDIDSTDGRAPARQSGGRRFKSRSSQFFFVHPNLSKICTQSVSLVVYYMTIILLLLIIIIITNTTKSNNFLSSSIMHHILWTNVNNINTQHVQTKTTIETEAELHIEINKGNKDLLWKRFQLDSGSIQNAQLLLYRHRN